MREKLRHMDIYRENWRPCQEVGLDKGLVLEE